MIAAIGVIGWVAFGVQGKTSASKVTPDHRDIVLTYRARLPQLPPDSADVQLWIPLATTRANQQIVARHVQALMPYSIGADPEYGNEMVHVRLTPPIAQPVEVAIEYHMRLVSGDVAGADQPPTSHELQRDLQPSGLVIIDDEVRARATRATEGRTTLKDRARGIYDDVIQHMTYDKHVPGWGRGDTRRACLLGKGNCTDFHSLLISMARAEHIPARFKIGTLIPSGVSGTIPGYHCWAELYVEGEGWVPVDASEAWKHPELAEHYFGARDADRWLLSVGRDIQLVPRQQGAPLNIFFYPYVEVNGQPFANMETEIRFQDLNAKGAT